MIKLKLSSQLIGQFGHVTASASCKQPFLKHSKTDAELDTLLYELLIPVERGVKNTENPFRVLLTSNAGELRCWKAY